MSRNGYYCQLLTGENNNYYFDDKVVGSCTNIIRKNREWENRKPSFLNQNTMLKMIEEFLTILENDEHVTWYRPFFSYNNDIEDYEEHTIVNDFELECNKFYNNKTKENWKNITHFLKYDEESDCPMIDLAKTNIRIVFDLPSGERKVFQIDILGNQGQLYIEQLFRDENIESFEPFYKLVKDMKELMMKYFRKEKQAD